MRTLRTLLLLILCCTYHVMVAQNPAVFAIDSLKNILKSMPEDSSKVMQMITISSMYSMSDPTAGFEMADQAEKLSKEIHFARGERSAYGTRAMLYIHLGKLDEARSQLDMALQMSIAANNQGDIGRSSGALGSIMMAQARYPEALDYSLKSMKAFEAVRDTVSLSAAINNIGAIHLEQKNYPEALKWLYQAKVINEQKGLFEYLAANLSNIAFCENELGHLDEAYKFYSESYGIAEKIGDMHTMTENLINLGTITRQWQDFESCYQTHLKAKQMAHETTSEYLIAHAYMNLASDLQEMSAKLDENKIKQITGLNVKAARDLALHYSDSSLAIYTTLDDFKGLMNIHKTRSEIYSSLGNIQSSFDAYKLYAMYQDSIFNMEKDKKIAQSAMQYEFDKKTDAARAEQEKKDAVAANIRNAILIGLGASLLFLIVVVLQRNKISKEKKRSEELLLNILPEEVAAELKSKGEADAVLIDQVTVLFTDFKGFTNISATMSPHDLVRDLHECFSAFDLITEKYNLEKIKTIGDAYMAAGGLPTPNQTHAQDAVLAAQEMCAFIENEKQKKIAAGKPFYEIRVGIHTGPVVAGIVGVKKFQYDIWGDTVNTASRMESHGAPGKINMSGTTYELVKDQFKTSYRGNLEVKGKGTMDMYFVENSVI